MRVQIAVFLVFAGFSAGAQVLAREDSLSAGLINENHLPTFNGNDRDQLIKFLESL